MKRSETDHHNVVFQDSIFKRMVMVCETENSTNHLRIIEWLHLSRPKVPKYWNMHIRLAANERYQFFFLKSDQNETGNINKNIERKKTKTRETISLPIDIA